MECHEEPTRPVTPKFQCALQTASPDLVIQRIAPNQSASNTVQIERISGPTNENVQERQVNRISDTPISTRGEFTNPTGAVAVLHKHCVNGTVLKATALDMPLVTTTLTNKDSFALSKPHFVSN